MSAEESEERKKEIKERMEKLIEEMDSDGKVLEKEMSKLTVVKGEISGIRKELGRRKAMIEGELKGEMFEEMGDALEILEREVLEKRRKVEEILKKEEERKAEEYLTSLKYLKADFENYRKRVEREKSESVEYAVESVLMKLLNIADVLETAIAQAKAEKSGFKNLIKGVDMILKQLKEILEEEGMVEIGAGAVGEKFDPFKHEALSKEIKESGEAEEDTVIEVVRKGYSRRNKVIRPAMVKIAIRSCQTNENLQVG